jgi:hypothetical protein
MAPGLIGLIGLTKETPMGVVTIQVPILGLMLLGFVWGIMTLLLSQYLTSGIKLINRRPKHD